MALGRAGAVWLGGIAALGPLCHAATSSDFNRGQHSFATAALLNGFTISPEPADHFAAEKRVVSGILKSAPRNDGQPPARREQFGRGMDPQGNPGRDDLPV